MKIKAQEIFTVKNKLSINIMGTLTEFKTECSRGTEEGAVNPHRGIGKIFQNGDT